jgi:hypothetical protein
LEANRAGVRMGQDFVGVGHLLCGLLTYVPEFWTRFGFRFSVQRYLKGLGLVASDVEAQVRGLQPVGWPDDPAPSISDPPFNSSGA